MSAAAQLTYSDAEALLAPYAASFKTDEAKGAMLNLLVADPERGQAILSGLHRPPTAAETASEQADKIEYSSKIGSTAARAAFKAQLIADPDGTVQLLEAMAENPDAKAFRQPPQPIHDPQRTWEEATGGRGAEMAKELAQKLVKEQPGKFPNFSAAWDHVRRSSGLIR